MSNLVELKPYKKKHTPLQRIIQKVDFVCNGCWIWTGYKWSTGYGAITIQNKRTLVHRYMYEAFFGKVKDGNMVCHKCDNPLCVSPLHLFEGTGSDNVQDAIKKGRRARVMNSPFVKGHKFYGNEYRKV